MTIIIEFGWQLSKPGVFKSKIMFRFWFLFFAVAITRKNLAELSSGSFCWISGVKDQPQTDS
jgi:hypothetical protein